MLHFFQRRHNRTSSSSGNSNRNEEGSLRSFAAGNNNGSDGSSIHIDINNDVDNGVPSDNNNNNLDNGVPIDVVRKLLIGALDPIELAKDILPPEDMVAVVRYNSSPYQPPVNLVNHDIVTKEDVEFVALSYVGFEGRLDTRAKLQHDRFVAHFKLIPETVLDVWKYFKQSEEDCFSFKELLLTLNWLKVCEYYFINQEVFALTFALFANPLIRSYRARSLWDMENG